MHTTIKSLPVFLILIFFCNNSFASAQDDFTAGVEYFKQKQYRQAIKSFTLASKKGLKKPALFHNLGVSYFKLGNYPQAKKYFEYARRFPEQKMLAEYNLGLVAKKQHKQTVARAHFLVVKKQAKDSKLITLARIQLGEIKTLKAEQKWFLFTKVGYGHDDNITVVPDTIATKKSSNFTSIYASGDVQLFGRAQSGLALTGFISNFDYVDYNQYDDSRFSLGIDATFRTGSWANSLALSSQQVTYGHTDYQKITRFEAKTRTSISSHNSLRFRYQHDDITSRNATYDYLAGTRQRLRTDLRHYGKRHYAKLYYEYEQNDRANTATANYSPTRNTLHGYYEYSLSGAFKIGAEINYRISTYPAKAATPEREDTRRRTGLNLSYKFNKTWKVRGNYELTDNSSTNAAYTYQRNMTTLSLIALF